MKNLDKYLTEQEIYYFTNCDENKIDYSNMTILEYIDYLESDKCEYWMIDAEIIEPIIEKLRSGICMDFFFRMATECPPDINKEKFPY